MTDRAAVNHATVVLVEQYWGKTLNELNCHLRPLDTIASTAGRSLKELEKNRTIIAKDLYGNNCSATNLVLQINKLRYKQTKMAKAIPKTLSHSSMRTTFPVESSRGTEETESTYYSTLVEYW